jgi:hypothetical protein
MAKGMAGTIGKFGLDFDGTNFFLTSKQTDCLAKDQCGTQAQKLKKQLSELQSTSCCEPLRGCC